MIELRLNEILKKRDHTLYWLAKETEIRYATIWSLSRGEFSALKMDTLDRICEVLKCQPGDLLKRIPDRKSKKKGK